MKKFNVNKIYNKDCVIGMKGIPDEKVDLIVTDPPFAINFKAKKANYNRTACLDFALFNCALNCLWIEAT